MKSYSLSIAFEIISFIIISIASFSFSQISSIIPIYKIILTEDINHLEINDSYNFCLKIKGNGIIFDNNSDINVMPMHIFNEMFIFYHDHYIDDTISTIEKLSDGYNEFEVVSSLSRFETIHFILKDIGITIPLNELFTPKNLTKHLYSFRFLGKEDQENIIIGKDLIKLMDIDFKDNENNFVIKNKTYISNVKDE
jgi:hypothetical protein